MRLVWAIALMVKVFVEGVDSASFCDVRLTAWWMREQQMKYSAKLPIIVL